MKGRLFFATVALWIGFLGFAFPPHSPPDIVAEVTSVIDGETIEVLLLKVPDKYGPSLQAGQIVRVRYIAVDAPEIDQANGERTAELNRILVEGRKVYLELDENWWDQQNQLLAYVYLDQYGYLMVNMILIASTAVKPVVSANQRYESVFETLRRVAWLVDPSMQSFLQQLRNFTPPPPPLELKVQYVRSMNRAGDTVTVAVAVETTPGANCQLTVYKVTYKLRSVDTPFGRLPSLPIRIEELEISFAPITAGPTGIVTWTWQAKSGCNYEIVITATLREETKTERIFWVAF